ncbi:hypothetical protein ODJ79_02075 [Actinoplanes sp. KI2]|uniref:hypothetical protein n=1 Tax=Actinoplanes sp. KI2 TaxID=2983315 RepID=UPI0021D5A6AF|nr:hypothetical protein [Actinoplanes sp. KI2]MCU7722492.1 hypothetical protein [Actinoplanes sp. KI2]
MSQPQQPAQPHPVPGAPAAPPAYGPPAGWAAAPPPAPYQTAPVPPAFSAPAYGAPAGHGPAPAAPGYFAGPQSPAGPAAQGYAGPPVPATQPYPAAPPAPYSPAPAMQPAPGQPFPGQQPHPGQMQFTACRLCGSVPAVDTTFRGHQGMIVMMRFLSTPGPFCRDCGLGVYRHMTSRTLLQGWYGYASVIITPITVLINLIRRGKVARLAPPQPNPHGPSRPPMNPGPSLLARPATYAGLAIPLIVLVFVIAVAAGGS